jgi:hypothetical protein
MNNRVWAAAAAATAAVTLTTTLTLNALQDSGAPSAKRPPSPAPASTCNGTRSGDGDGDGSPADAPLFRTADRIDQVVSKRYSGVFTGLSVDRTDAAADIWRIPSAAFDTAACAAAEKGVTLRLHDTDISRKRLDALAERASADMNRWNGTFRLREVGVDERGFVRIGVDDPARAVPALEEAFGTHHLEVVHVAPVEAASSTARSPSTGG